MKAFSNERPQSLANGGAGSYLYHWNIEEKEIETEDGHTQVQYEYDEVRVYAPLSANKIVRAVISELWNKDVEQKLINEYNATVLLSGDEQAVEKYRAFLTERAAVKAQVEKDCEDLGIK